MEKKSIWAKISGAVVNGSLKRKLIALLMFANVFLFGVASILGISIVVKNNDESLRRVMASSLAKSASDIHGALQDIETIMFRMTTDPTIQDALSKVQDNSDDVITVTDAYRIVGNTLSTYITQFSEYYIQYITLD